MNLGLTKINLLNNKKDKIDLSLIAKFEKGNEVGSSNYHDYYKNNFTNYIRVGDLISLSNTYVDKNICNKFAKEEDINKIVKTYKNFREGTLENVGGFCKLADIEKIKSKDYSLNPGRYVGTDSSQQLSEEEIKEELKKSTKELLELMKEGNELEDKVRKILEEEIK